MGAAPSPAKCWWRSPAMKHAPFLVAVAASAAVLAAANAALAQEERIWRPPGGNAAQGDIQLFRQPGFRGPHIRAQTAVHDLGITWSVRSSRVNSGRWRACTGLNFTGTCRDLTGSMAVVTAPLTRIRSLNPIAQPPTGGGGGGPSLRGMAATFFSQPAANGQRVLACRSGQAT